MQRDSKYNDVFIEAAEIWAKKSYCKRAKIGSVIVKDDRIISTGINGTISGTENICEEYTTFESKDEYESIENNKKIKCCDCNGTGEISIKGTPYEEDCRKCKGYGYLKSLDKTNIFTLHAEANAILWAAKEGTALKDTSIFITHSPCPECAKLIAQAGIKEVYFKDDYRDTRGIDFLKSCKVVVRRIT